MISRYPVFRQLIISSLFFLCQSFYSQTSPFLDSLLKADMPRFANVLNNPGKYKVQVVYTKIDRDKDNIPKFTDYRFHATKNYFYPASTVKLPVSLLALIKLQELDVKGLYKNTPMITDSAFYCQKKISRDSDSESGYPTLETYIKKMFLVSDNSSCARTYEFVGFDYAHAKLEELGYKNIRLFNRLDGACQGDTAKITPPVYFLGENKDTIYRQPLTTFSLQLTHPIANSKVGRNGKKYMAKDFSRHNYFAITDLHSMMRKIVFNNHLSKKEKLPLSDGNREFMLKQLGLYPKESLFPKYDKKNYYDTFKKYFLWGSAVATINQDSIRMINIVGRAYGFLIDCAYIMDFKNNVEYLITAGIYVNERNTFGSGRYEYDQIGLPFLKDLSWCIYNYERKRKKDFQPDLKEFRDLFTQ